MGPISKNPFAPLSHSFKCAQCGKNRPMSQQSKRTRLGMVCTACKPKEGR